MLNSMPKTYNILTVCGTRKYFIILSILIVLLGGLLALFWREQQRQFGHAANDVVVGPPSLSATAVDALFTRLGSPMAGTGQVVEQASRNTNIDDAFALAVWWAETNDGMAGVGVGYHNPGGVQGSPSYPSNGYTVYPSYEAAVTDWFNILQSRYISRGLTSVYTICYPYVGTSGALNWANKVMYYMSSYRALSPSPTPTPVVTPTLVPTPAVVLKPKTDTHKAVHQQHITQAVASSTQLLLVGLGLMIALLLAVPGLLIYRKPRTRGQPLTGFSIPNLVFRPEQGAERLPATTTLSMEAISAQRLSMSQYSSALEGEVAHAINTGQLAFEVDTLPTIPVSSSTQSLLQPVPNERVAVPTTPIQRVPVTHSLPGNWLPVSGVPTTPIQHVPVTPPFRNVPVTPLMSHGSQGGLLTRYKEQRSQEELSARHSSQDGLPIRHNMQNRPRRIALTRPPDTINPHPETRHQQ